MGMTNRHPNKTLTIYIKQIIIAKLQFEYYARNSNLYRTEEDEVIEVTTEEQLKTWHSSCINYSDQFVRGIVM